MHEAEKVITGYQQTATYSDNLMKIVGYQTLHLFATAAQRAEAFLRTIEKWEEEEIDKFIEQRTMETEIEQMKQKAEGYLQDYLDALKRIDDLAADYDEAVRSCHIWQKGHSDIVAERNLWKAEATRWRDMYLEYDEMLECQVQEAMDRLNKVWEDLDKLKKKVQDDLQ